MSALLLLLLGVVVFPRGKSSPGITLPDGAWVWPMLTLPKLGHPVISDGFGSSRNRGEVNAHSHKGVDIMYRRPHPLIGKLRYPLPDHGSRMFEVPPGALVVAAHRGRIWSTGKTPLGHFVIIDHGPEEWATFYQHLDELIVPHHTRGKMANGNPGMEVEVASPLGTAGHSMVDGQRLRHLHFELRRGTKAIDPAPLMQAWEVL